jgi:hypothetical protein
VAYSLRIRDKMGYLVQREWKRRGGYPWKMTESICMIFGPEGEGFQLRNFSRKYERCGYICTMWWEAGISTESKGVNHFVKERWRGKGGILFKECGSEPFAKGG